MFRPPTSTAALVVAAAVLVSAPAFAAPKGEISKPLKTVVQAVRYKKDKLALKHFAGEAQGRLLTTDDWDKATPAERREFVELFQTLFAKIAFPRIRANFEHLDAITYDDPVVEGDRAKVGSTIVINHPLKKQELKVKYELLKEGKAWKVVDVAVLGDSMLAGIREDQVKPLLEEGGWKLLLETMRKKAKELESVTLN